jgi:hypothetical protein
MEDFHRELQSNPFIDPKNKPEISFAGTEMIDLFFSKDKTTFFDRAFEDVDEYRKTKMNVEGANTRVTMPLHHIILDILKKNGFDDYYLSLAVSSGRNLFGGITNKHNNKKITRKNKKQRLRKTVSKKNKKIKRIKLTISNKVRNASLKKYKKNTLYKIIKK